ncbi:hypothetical protein E2C01_018786 [Portunus trituberculatus]|uniref:Uncharacterized protein n=1 Tax=Portunus trituberculatus TaxID=210409 RepID=A0A5B7DY14_PORTR|nr:hypothetical protein [Portunus trituberculatus]
MRANATGQHHSSMSGTFKAQPPPSCVSCVVGGKLTDYIWKEERSKYVCRYGTVRCSLTQEEEEEEEE